MTTPLEVIWHDLECHGYSIDMPLWRELAAEHSSPERPILDVGAGTGRISLDLARAGYAVTALDSDPKLLAALRERAAAAGLAVETVLADARGFDLGRRFGLIILPMQTIQMIGDRTTFFAAARAHLAPGGILAAAIAYELVPFELDESLFVTPEVGEADGWRFVSQVTAVRELETTVEIHRRRIVQDPDGQRAEEDNLVEFTRVTPALIEAEGVAAGLTPEPALRIPDTFDHIGSTVVMLRG